MSDHASGSSNEKIGTENEAQGGWKKIKREQQKESERGRLVNLMTDDEWEKKEERALLRIGRKNDGEIGEHSAEEDEGGKIGGGVRADACWSTRGEQNRELKVPAARWRCSHRPLLTGREGAAGPACVATAVLAEVGHRAILSAIETGARRAGRNGGVPGSGG